MDRPPSPSSNTSTKSRAGARSRKCVNSAVECGDRRRSGHLLIQNRSLDVRSAGRVVARALLYMDATSLGRDSDGRQPPFPLDGSPEMWLPLVMYQDSTAGMKTLPTVR
jgi:hypothetical protein